MHDLNHFKNHHRWAFGSFFFLIHPKSWHYFCPPPHRLAMLMVIVNTSNSITMVLMFTRRQMLQNWVSVFLNTSWFKLRSLYECKCVCSPRKPFTHNPKCNQCGENVFSGLLKYHWRRKLKYKHPVFPDTRYGFSVPLNTFVLTALISLQAPKMVSKQWTAGFNTLKEKKKNPTTGKQRSQYPIMSLCFPSATRELRMPGILENPPAHVRNSLHTLAVQITRSSQGQIFTFSSQISFQCHPSNAFIFHFSLHYGKRFFTLILGRNSGA